MKYYNLDMIVAIGFRVKSNIGTNFRIWSNERLIEYIQKGFTMNDSLLKRADGNKDFMGLTSFEGNIPTLHDATIAKNYLSDKELDILNRIVSMYLDYAELQAIEERTMKMNDWVEELNYFLTMNRKDILQDCVKITHEYAMSHVEREYNTFKDRIKNLPSEVEIHYLESISELEQISGKNN